MIKVILKHAMIGWMFLFIMAFCLLSAPAFSADKAVAKLTSFSGTVLIKSRGDWGTKPEAGLTLYSDDKVITKMGIATITFDDGAVIEIKANSNLLIRDTEQSGVSRQLGTAKRQIRLLLGKLLFRSGKGSSVATSLETTTMVCGLRGTAGTLSIDAAGQTYLQFTEGGGDTIGNFIAGIAADVPLELASLNPAQRASFVAAAAADQARRVAEKVAAGEATNADAALASANAAEAAAREALAAAEAMLNNPDESIRNEAGEAVRAAQEAIDAAKDAQQRAIDAGATGAAQGKDTGDLIATTGFDVPSGNFLDGKDDEAVLGSSYGVLGDELTRQVFSPTTQGNENQVLPSSDNQPPVIEVTYAPSGFMSTTTPVFDFSADEYSTYYYQLDGGTLILIGSASQDEVQTLTLSGLPEGNHTLELFAQDATGNRSQLQTFSWVQDTIAPVPVLTAMPDGSGATNLGATFSNTELGSVTYNFVIINSDGLTVPTSNLATGVYTATVVGTDQAGNVSQPQQFSFTIQNSTLTGTITGTGSVITGTAIGGVSAIATAAGQGLGGWTNTLSGNWSGTHTGTISIVSGGSAPETGGNWLSFTSGTMNTTTGAASGTTDYIMMNLTTLTEGTGTFTANFNNDSNRTWSGTETGSSLTTRPLRYSGSLASSSFYNYTTRVADSTPSYALGYGGAAQNGSLLDGVFLGEYANETGAGPYLLVATVTDPMDDQTPDALVPTIWKNGLINGFLAATYDDLTTTGGDAGIFYENLTGSYYAGIGSSSSDGMWLTKAQITPIEMVHDVGINGDTRYMDWPTTEEIQPIIFQTPEGGNISFDENAIVGASTILPVKVRNSDNSLYMLFGAWGAGLTGSYSAASDGWTLSLADNASSHMLMEFGPGTTNSTWTSSTQEISAFAAGAWVDLTEAVTGVAGGKLIGTFDPANQVWQAVAAGGIVDTKTFLAMASTDAGRAKLTQLDIPCIQVGTVDLSGTGTGNLTSVSMKGVEFFAYSTGAAPKIWATGDVSGTTVGSAANSSVSLSGSNGTTSFSNVTFTMSSTYNTQVGAVWDASVSGNGTVSGNSVSIQGAAAGNVTSVIGTGAPLTTFSGTASGVTRPPN
jgi:hypothetical protein